MTKMAWRSGRSRGACTPGIAAGSEGEKGRILRTRPLPGNPYFWALVLLILVLVVLYAYGFWSLHLPFRSSGYDGFNHMGLLRLTESKLGLGPSLDPDLFPGLYEKNERLGINYVAMALLSALPGSSEAAALFAFGLLGIALFLSGIYYLARTLSGSQRVGFLAALLSLLLGPYELLPRGNSFSLVEMLIDAHYASVLAMGMFMFALGLCVRYLREGRRRDYLLAAALSLLVFNVHLLSGIQYFSLLVLLVLTFALSERRFHRRHLHLLLLVPLTLLLASAWPLYHWWSIFGKNPLIAGNDEGAMTSLLPFLERSVLFFAGLPFLLRRARERVFLLAWALAFALVSLSYWLPVSVAYYWRFAMPMRIPLVVGLALGLGRDIWSLQRWKAATVTVVLITSSAFLGTSAWRTGLRFDYVLQGNAYQSLEAFKDLGGEGERLVAHPAAGYDLMGISSFQVISVLGHAPASLVRPRNELLGRAFSTPDPSLWKALLEEYGARRVLVPRPGSYRDLALLLNGIRVARNPYYELWEVDPEKLDTEVLSSLPDPGLEESEVRNGFLRCSHWADVQVSGAQDIVLSLGVEENGDRYLSAQCSSPEAAMILLNRGYLSLDPERLYSLRLRYRQSQEEPFVQLVIFQYDAPAANRLLGISSLVLEPSVEAWKEVSYSLARGTKSRPDLLILPQAALVKVGVYLFGGTTGKVDLDEIDLRPWP